MRRILYSGHVSIAKVIYRSQFTLPPRIDLSIADKPNSRPYKTFLIRNLYRFYFRQCATVLLSFLRSLLFYFLASLMAFFGSLKIKICKDFHAILNSMVNTFPSCKDVLSTMGRDRNIDSKASGLQLY